MEFLWFTVQRLTFLIHLIDSRPFMDAQSVYHLRTRQRFEYYRIFIIIILVYVIIHFHQRYTNGAFQTCSAKTLTA